MNIMIARLISLFVLLFAAQVIAQDSASNKTLFNDLRDYQNQNNQYLQNYNADGRRLEDFAKTPDVSITPPLYEGEIRDPFNLSSPALPQGGGLPGSTFLPNVNQQKLPSLRLKGVVNSGNDGDKGDLLALLQIGNSDVFMVKVGDEISYDPTRPNTALKIVTINRLSVTVQVGTLGNMLIVR